MESVVTDAGLTGEGVAVENFFGMAVAGRALGVGGGGMKVAVAVGGMLVGVGRSLPILRFATTTS